MTAIVVHYEAYEINPVGEFFARLRTRYDDWAMRRETRLALNDLSDRSLRDIGLTRADIPHVVSKL